MEALDLTTRPPRSPREELDGIAFLPRTIDKIRATLPGGNLGDYSIDGFSTRLLEELAISEDDLRSAVAAATTDADVAAWLRKRSDPARYAEITQKLANRRIRDVADPQRFRGRYPAAEHLSDDTPLFEVLERDDAAAFANL